MLLFLLVILPHAHVASQRGFFSARAGFGAAWVFGRDMTSSSLHAAASDVVRMERETGSYYIKITKSAAASKREY